MGGCSVLVFAHASHQHAQDAPSHEAEQKGGQNAAHAARLLCHVGQAGLGDAFQIHLLALGFVACAFQAGHGAGELFAGQVGFERKPLVVGGFVGQGLGVARDFAGFVGNFVAQGLRPVFQRFDLRVLGREGFELGQLGGGGDGLMVFNHPGREDAIHSVLLQIGEGLGQATRMAGALNALNVFRKGDPAYAFNDFKYIAPADYRVVGLEVFGKGDEYDTDGKFGSWYGHALDKGWYLGPVGSEDHHATDWGGSSLPKTVVIARNNTQAEIREAFLARRFYTVAQQENALRIRFDAVQGEQRHPMGSRIGTRNPTVQFEFDVRSVDPLDSLQGVSVELFSSQAGPSSNSQMNYAPLAAQPAKTGQFSVAPAEGKNWYFLRVKRGDRIVAVSAPIWIFQGANPLPECGS